ncbi:MAG: rod shape-determining protein MreD [Bacteroidales bacterium]
MSIDILIKNITGFFILLILQVLIFNNIGITSWKIVPAFFILIILLMPFETPGWLLLILSFILGLIIDIFTDTIGLNSFSCVLIAFLRPLVLSSMSPRGGYDAGTFPRVHYMGLAWFIRYSAILIFVHQFAYYFLDDFGFGNFWRDLLKILIGTFFTALLIIVSQFLVYRK